MADIRTQQDETIRAVEEALAQNELANLANLLAQLPVPAVVDLLGRLDGRDRAVTYRMLPKGEAIAVFELLDPSLQGDLVRALQDEQVAELFATLDPDDRVELLDELPATVARKLLQGLPSADRELTAVVLGYPHGSIGRRMSPEFVKVRTDMTATAALAKITDNLAGAETVYRIPVTNNSGVLIGIVGLRELLLADPDTLVGGLVAETEWARATDTAEQAARQCADRKLLALPVVDNETRLVGILTVDNALQILEEADSEDQARIGGTEPLRRPYLTAPVLGLMKSRLVWLLVLAVGATLTVQVLEVFEGTLAEVVTLALFVPLLIGTGGNTGNQAATTVTRALALGDVHPRDAGRVFWRELRVGLSLGLVLGTVAFTVVSLVYDPSIGTVIGLTFLALCAMAASVGGLMPLLARAVGADPAVFANPFISTFVDATGLLVYFLIAKAVLGI